MKPTFPTEFDSKKFENSNMDTLLIEGSIGNPLAHLSSTQIEEIHQRYLAGERTDALIEAFEIPTGSKSLLTILPHIVRLDLMCPYCSHHATERRRSRAGEQPIPSCSGCAHVYVEQEKWCSCEGCRQKYISQLNGGNRHPSVPYSELTIREKVILLSALSLTKAWHLSSFSFNQWQRTNRKFAPTRTYHTSCQNELFERKIILVSEDTTYEQLQYARDLNGIDLLLWRPNVSRTNATETPLGIDELRTILADDLAESSMKAAPFLIELIYELSIEELMEYLDSLINKTSLKFEVRVATRKVIETCLPSKSLNCIYTFILQAVKSADNAFTNNRISEATHAGDLIPLNISMAAESFNTRSSKYMPREPERVCKLKISELSHTVYGLILKNHNEASNIPLPRYIDEVVKPTLEANAR